VFEGLDAGEFMIITDPRIADFALPRLDEIAAEVAAETLGARKAFTLFK
jgi:hypothetical protein